MTAARAAACLALASLALAGCSSASLEKSTTTHVTVAGDSYAIAQLTASTWIATAAGKPRVISGSMPGKAALLSAIEQVSGCKVTDSDYSRQGMQLDAQVDCGSRLKN